MNQRPIFSHIKNIHIGNRIIGEKKPVFVIAEAGVNHNGNFDTACQLIKEAAAAGADCIKFQTFQAERIVSPTSPKPSYQIRNTGIEESQYKMLKRLEMPQAWYKPLKQLCEKENIIFLSTPYDVEDIYFLESLDVLAYKIPSALAVEPDYIKYIAQIGKPIFLSTGMCTSAEVIEAVQWIRNTGNNEIIVFQCTTNYPSKPKDCNLLTIPAISSSLSVHIGYSDHTEGILAATTAVALGACVIERHFTLDKNLPGPDHLCSSEPKELRSLIIELQKVQEMLGCAQKQPCETELENRETMRRSIVAACDIPTGTVLRREHIAYKRPASGLSPRHIQDILGRRITRFLQKNEIICYSDLDEKMSSPIKGVSLQSLSSHTVTTIFEEIASSEVDVALFHPHPFTSKYARTLCESEGQDIYIFFLKNEEILGYGMLRGWDNGYKIPSLGIFIRKRYRGQGIAIQCMNLLHKKAIERKSTCIQLSVHKKNFIAIMLYKKCGYQQYGTKGEYKLFRISL